MVEACWRLVLSEVGISATGAFLIRGESAGTCFCCWSFTKCFPAHPNHMSANVQGPVAFSPQKMRTSQIPNVLSPWKELPLGVGRVCYEGGGGYLTPNPNQP